MLYALKIATRYLTASKAQTALLVLGVAVGVFIFIFMSALIGGLARMVIRWSRRPWRHQPLVTIREAERPRTPTNPDRADGHAFLAVIGNTPGPGRPLDRWPSEPWVARWSRTVPAWSPCSGPRIGPAAAFLTRGALGGAGQRHGCWSGAAEPRSDLGGYNGRGVGTAGFRNDPAQAAAGPTDLSLRLGQNGGRLQS